MTKQEAQKLANDYNLYQDENHRWKVLQHDGEHIIVTDEFKATGDGCIYDRH